MTVRRLADSDIQPEGFAFNRANSAWARKAIGKYPKGREHSAVIPLLMRAQEQEGWVTKAAIEHVADMIGMPYIRALEVATFYTQFQLHPVGTKAHVQVCGTTPCMLRGAQELVEVCKRKINPEPFHTNEDGTLSWEEVECQGACVNAPMVMIFKDTYEDLTAERLEEIIDAFEAGKGDRIKPGPQVDRITSAPIIGLTSLTDEQAVTGGAAKAGRKNGRDSGAKIPPSRAAKPRTAAPETDPTLKSPSAEKADQNGEKAASVRRPRENKTAADLSDPAVEGEARPRHHAGKHKDDPKAFHSPQTAGGDAVGPAGKRRPGEKAAKPGKPSPEGTREARKSGKIAHARKPGKDDESGAE
jgi:NADH-quinone oxidoreductase subunit E